MESGISEVGFDDDFESLKGKSYFFIENVEIKGFQRFEIPGRECHPSTNRAVAYIIIREWNFEEWGYAGGIVIEKVMGNIRRLRRQRWDGPD